MFIQKESIQDYFDNQQTENSIRPIEYKKIISLFKNNKYSIKKISSKYCKKQLRNNRFKKILLPIYLKAKERLDG